MLTLRLPRALCCSRDPSISTPFLMQFQCFPNPQSVSPFAWTATVLQLQILWLVDIGESRLCTACLWCRRPCKLWIRLRVSCSQSSIRAERSWVGDTVSTSVPGLSEKHGIPWEGIFLAYVLCDGYTWNLAYWLLCYISYSLIVWFGEDIMQSLSHYNIVWFFSRNKTLSHGSYEICLCGILVP